MDLRSSASGRWCDRTVLEHQSQVRAADCFRIRQLAGINVAREREHEFVRRGRIKDVSKIRHDFLGSRGCNYVRGIGQCPRRSPPDADGVLIVFNLAGVGDREFVVIAERIVDFAGGFPAVLRNLADVLKVVPTVGGRGSDIRLREEGCDAADIQIVIAGGHRAGSGRQAVRCRVGVLPNAAAARGN